MNLFYLIMQEAATKGGGLSSNLKSFLPLILIVVVFWLFFIRPQSKKNKELSKFRKDLQNGTKVLTNGGIHGKIVEVSETTVVIETAGQTRLKIEKSAIASEITNQAEQKKD